MIIDILGSFSTGFLSGLFFFTGSVKLFRWQKSVVLFQLELMHKYGLNSAIYSLVGFFEIAGSIGLLFQGEHVLGTLSAIGVFLLSLSAFGFHLKFDSFEFGLPALITAVLSLFVAVVNSDYLAGLPGSLGDLPASVFLSAQMEVILPAAIGALLAAIFFRQMIAMATEQVRGSSSL